MKVIQDSLWGKENYRLLDNDIIANFIIFSTFSLDNSSFSVQRNLGHFNSTADEYFLYLYIFFLQVNCTYI